MNHIYVVHCKKYPDAHYVGRSNPSIKKPSSALSNPFKWDKSTPKGSTLPKYREWFMKWKWHPAVEEELEMLLEELIKGDLYLSCWCAPHPCHADVIKDHLMWRYKQYLKQLEE